MDALISIGAVVLVYKAGKKLVSIFQEELEREELEWEDEQAELRRQHLRPTRTPYRS